MNKTSLKYFILAALCLGLILGSCKGGKKQVEQLPKVYTSDMPLTDTTGTFKLGGMLTPNTTISSFWTDATEIESSYSVRPNGDTIWYVRTKYDTIYIYRDTCIEGINDPGFHQSAAYTLGTDSNGVIIIVDTMLKGNGKIRLNHY